MHRTKRFSTGAASSPTRHRAWQAQGEPAMGSVFDAIPDGAFKAHVETILVGPITLLFGWYGAQTIRRGARERAEQPLDVLCLTMAGTMAFSGPAYVIRPGEIGLLDFTRDFEHHSTAGSLASVVIPRALIEQGGLDCARLHGRVLSESHASILRDHVFSLRLIAEHLPEEQSSRAARSIVDILAMTLALSAQGAEALSAQFALTLKERAERIITSQLDHDELDADMLCQALNVSRTTLYALYRDENGVHNRIRREKLERAKEALNASTMKIGEIATQFGFHDHAHFSRIFKEAYGLSPSSWRAKVRTEA
jgi:AraC-like DNA-binding protein